MITKYTLSSPCEHELHTGDIIIRVSFLLQTTHHQANQTTLQNTWYHLLFQNNVLIGLKLYQD